MSFRIRLYAMICSVLFTAACAYAEPSVQPLTTRHAEIKSLFEHGEYAEAAAQMENLLETETLEPERETDVLLKLAGAYQHLGMYRNAIQTLNDALNVVSETDDRGRAARVLSRYSDAMIIAADLEMALKMADKAVVFAKEANNPPVLSRALNALGNALAVWEFHPAAVEKYTESMAEAAKTEDWSMHARAAVNRFKSALYGSELDEVVKVLDEARQAVAKLSVGHEKAVLMLTLANLMKFTLNDSKLNTAQRTHIKQGMNEVLNEAGQVAEAAKDSRSASLAYGNLAELYEKDRRYQEAKALNRRAVFFARHNYNPEVRYLWEWQQGRIFKALGDYDQAVNAYRAAAETLQPVRHKLNIGYRMPDVQFDESVRPVYYGMADLLLLQADAAKDKAEQQRLYKEARDAVEVLKLAELQDYFKDECVASFQTQAETVDKNLQGTAVVYPIPLPDRLALLVSMGGEIIHVTVADTDVKTVNDTAKELRRRLQTRPNNKFLFPATKLYDWLVRPLLPHLQANRIDTLVFVPDGSLRLIPFSTLYDGKQFLVENYALAVVPGLSLLDPKNIDWKNSEILLVGLSEAVQGYPPLPNVGQELATIQEIAGKGDKIENKDYSIDSFRDMLSKTDYAVIHMATHGEFSSDPDHTYLLTYGEKLTIDKLQDVIGLGKYREQAVELLTLSACRTGVGDDRAALGLAGVAVKAGARSAIASLWFVDDEATAMMMKSFYREVVDNPGLTKAKALQRIQKMLIAQDRYWHPSYWGPFLLIGNWL